jgi:Copper type II ascorbate-dependent monooxygenase, C-terminal domain
MTRKVVLRALGALAIGLALGGFCECERSEGPRPPPTYSEDVAPILVNNCVSCHRTGGIAPFSLLSYDDARRHAGAIKASTATRSMPPFNLDNSGACNTYVEARWLSDAQIATLGAWVDGGTPVGDPAKPPLPPPPLTSLDRVDLTLDMGTPYTPNASREDDYRCFVIDPGLQQKKFITGFQIHPGEARMVHHLTLFALDTPEAEQQAAALETAGAGHGYECFGDARVPSRWLVGSGPGGGALLLPEGTGLPMLAGRKTVLQMHYNRLNGTFPDRTTIDLRLASSVRHEALVVRLADLSLYLPPQQPEVIQSTTLPVPEAATLWGLWPHMHTLGSKLDVTLSHEGKERCLARVPRWDFHWQGFADYTTPIHVEAGDAMKITCTYDTRGRATATSWGQGTEDEMCVAFFYITPDR